MSPDAAEKQPDTDAGIGVIEALLSPDALDKRTRPYKQFAAIVDAPGPMLCSYLANSTLAGSACAPAAESGRAFADVACLDDPPEPVERASEAGCEFAA